MSGEILSSISLEYAKGGDDASWNHGPQSIDVSGDNQSKGTLDLTTSWEAIPLGDIATVGVIVVKNIGSTNNAEIRGSLTGDPWIVLKPGEEWSFRMSPTGFTAPAARAAASTTRLKFLLIED